METKDLESIRKKMKFRRYEPVDDNVEHWSPCAYQCPSCLNIFGIDKWFALQVAELNYKFACPYCREEHSLGDES